MRYLLMGHDAPNNLELRRSLRPAHMARLNKLMEEGRLTLAGALPAIDSVDPGPAGFTGSLIVADFDTLAEAEAWWQADPFVTGGVYAGIRVSPFRQALPTSD